MADTFVMSSRQSAELDHAFERNGWTADDVKWLSKGDTLATILTVRRGMANIVPTPLLQFIGTITLPARTARFIPGKSYVVNTKPGSHVKIGWIDSDFTAWFDDKAEEPTAETTLRCHVLTRPSVFALAMKEIASGGVAVETTPGELYSLLEKQPDGPNSPEGLLLTDGSANLFKMIDKGGVARLVRAYWYDAYAGWDVYAYDASSSLQWSAGRLLFSRDSRLASAA